MNSVNTGQTSDIHTITSQNTVPFIDTTGRTSDLTLHLSFAVEYADNPGGIQWDTLASGFGVQA
jgi:hypothetical protein